MFPKQNPNIKSIESSADFLARGGKITKIVEGDTGKRKTRKSGKIDAQALLDAANNEAEEQVIISFLKSQGVNVT